MKTKKTTNQELRWRVEIQADDFTLFTKKPNEALWTQEAIETLGPLPPIKWESNKRARETPGDSQGDRPPQPWGWGTVTPPGAGTGAPSLGGSGAAGGGEAAAAAAAAAGAAAAGGAMGNSVLTLASVFKKTA